MNKFCKFGSFGEFVRFIILFLRWPIFIQHNYEQTNPSLSLGFELAICDFKFAGTLTETWSQIEKLNFFKMLWSVRSHRIRNKQLLIALDDYLP